MVADRRLRRRREENLVQLGGVLVARAELLAVHRLRLLVFLPAGPREIAAGDALDLDHLHLLHEHRTPTQILLVGLQLGRILIDIRSDEVVLHAEELEPEERKLVQYLALVGDSARKDDVKRADAVGDDHQQLVAEIEDIADLAALLGNAGDCALQQRMILVVFHNS